MPVASETLIVADIGGTGIRLAAADRTGPDLETQRAYERADFPTPADAIRTYARDAGLKLDGMRACFAVAAPLILGDEIRFTNSPWRLSRQQLQKDLALSRVRFINDFEAVAWSLRNLAEDDCVRIGGGEARPGTMQAVLGPGTGLGVALFQPPDGPAVHTEGGHVEFAPTNELEIRLLRYAWKQFGRVSVERFLCGSGLSLLHRFLHDEALSPSQITTAALQRNSDACKATINHFCGILGSVAGNLALTTGALGGIYIAGGIMPRIKDLLIASPFRERFEDKGRFREYVRNIPVSLITAPQPGLRGAAVAAFVLD